MNHRKPFKQPKYRPYLTASDIAHILQLCKSESPLSTESKNLIKILSPYMAKIENDALEASYTPTGRTSLIESLGGTTPTEDTPSDFTLSPAQQREQAYNKWNSQGEQACTLRELELAYEYRVHHDLLTDSEAKAEDESWNVDMSQYTTLSPLSSPESNGEDK